ncbi:hypothetical protein C8R43DRAFT_1130525 [Mycena crocata]|nr:hypothetical protein C8R43DRAFT_1130525 [Mycena crocata]
MECKGFTNFENTYLLRAPIRVAKRKEQQLERDLRLGLRPATPDPLDTWLSNNHIAYFTAVRHTP